MSDEVASHRADAVATKDRAAEWLQRREFWDWKTEDQNALDVWLAEAPEHEVAFIRMERTWARTERMAALRKPRNDVSPSTVWFRSVLMRAMLSVAALALLGTSGALLYLSRAAGREYSTAIGETRLITLTDGSRIHLNTDSMLRFSAQGRSAVLERGEAYFEIRHNSSVAFTVIAAGHRVTDIGTKFSVRADSGNVEVSVIGGKARIDDMKLSSDSRAAVLTPGDVAIATQNDLVITHKPIQRLMNDLTWQRGILIFDDITLAQAVDELGRYSKRKIVIADAAISQRIIYGAVPTNDLDAFVRVARSVMGLHVQTVGDELVISR